jgi:ABC-type multidrug transport system ATPase subunit
MISGISVDGDIASIRKIIGVCPQFDILWDELTAGEHVELFHHLKHLSVSKEKILSSLESVGLEKNMDGRVTTFSGGMRRRLSLALSLVGGPELVILDEPTTGMDARVRLQTWKLILGLRLKHTVLITTHNMEEAECVSDKIMIMSKGRVIAEGTALQLKKEYGQGYVIRGFDRAKNEDVVLRCKEGELEDMLRDLEKGEIENWSLHETTLEEVFLNVTNRY